MLPCLLGGYPLLQPDGAAPPPPLLTFLTQPGRTFPPQSTKSSAGFGAQLDLSFSVMPLQATLHLPSCPSLVFPWPLGIEHSVSSHPCILLPQGWKLLGWGLGQGPLDEARLTPTPAPLCPSGGDCGVPLGWGLSKLPFAAWHTAGGCRAHRVLAVGTRIFPLITPLLATHTRTRASYRDGIFNFFGITIGKWPHETHDQPFKLPRQLILQVSNEVLR